MAEGTRRANNNAVAEDAPLVVAVCTFRRPAVTETLSSLFGQTRLPDRIVVIDNDDLPSTAARIAEAAKGAPVPVTFRHAPSQNIAIARNAALDVAPRSRLAFIDDDEVAAPDWLERLEAALAPGLAAVFGPSIATYPPEAPTWMQTLSPHSQFVSLKRGGVVTGHTANCLIDLRDPALAGHRFQEALGRRGAEDSDFFDRAFARGANFALAPDALVYEPVTPDRMAFGWLLRRRFRHGRAHGRRHGEKNAFGLMISALAKTGYCGVDAALHAFSPAGRNRAILRGALHAGIAAGAATMRRGEATQAAPALTPVDPAEKLSPKPSTGR